MLSPPTSSATTALGAEGAARVARQLAALADLAELGMELTRAIVADAKAPAGSPHRFTGDIALMFARVSKAIRLTLVLEARLAQGLQAQQGAEIDLGADLDDRTPQPPITDEDAVELNPPDPADPGDAERRERLTDQAEHARLDDRPIGEWVSIICEHLGVPFDAPLWAEPAVPLSVAARPAAAAGQGERAREAKVTRASPLRPVTRPPPPP